MIRESVLSFAVLEAIKNNNCTIAQIKKYVNSKSPHRYTESGIRFKVTQLLDEGLIISMRSSNLFIKVNPLYEQEINKLIEDYNSLTNKMLSGDRKL